MKKTLSSCILALSLLAFASCSSDVEDVITDDITSSSFVEAPKCDGTVTVSVNNFESRASNADGTIDNYTATRCQSMNASYSIVSYHGRNQAQIGMVQIIRNSNGQVVSELCTQDARVNFVQYRKSGDKETAYIGVDRQGAGGIMCGIICVPMSGGKFISGTQYESFVPYKVDGLSINCLKYSGYSTVTETGDKVLFVAAGGNALGDTGEAGFTKFGIDPENPERLTVLSKYSGTNFRGYWFSYDFIGSCPVAYTYRTVSPEGHLQYVVGMIDKYKSLPILADDNNFIGEITSQHKVIEAVCWDREGISEDRCRFGVSTFPLGGSTYLVVATGSKEAGLQVWRHDGAEDTLVLVDTWHKACLNSSSIYTDSETGESYIFVSCAEDGVFKMRVDRDEETKDVRLVPVKKRVTTVHTESGSLASTNYVQLLNGKLHVAGGYEGYFALDLDDPSFVDADPRK